MLTNDEHLTRAWAVMAAVADGRHTDIEPLIADLDPEDIGTLISNLATLAVHSLIPPHLRRDPATLARLADGMRDTLLDRARGGEEDQGGDDA